MFEGDFKEGTMETKASAPKGPISHLPAGPEHRHRSDELTRTAAPLDSAAIDNALLCRTNEWLNGKIRDATWQLKRALSLPVGARRDMHLNLALKALGGLGAS